MNKYSGSVKIPGNFSEGGGVLHLGGFNMIRLKTTLLILASLSSACAQVEPNAGAWQTWILSSGNQMRLPAPPDDTATASELALLKTLTASADDAARARIVFGTPDRQPIAGSSSLRRRWSLGILPLLYIRAIWLW